VNRVNLNNSDVTQARRDLGVSLARRIEDRTAGFEVAVLMMCEAIAIHEAFQRGDLEALKDYWGICSIFWNWRGLRGQGEIILEYAIYHSPLSFVANAPGAGRTRTTGPCRFPSLIATISTHRAEKYEIAKLLLDFARMCNSAASMITRRCTLRSRKKEARLIELLLSEEPIRREHQN